KAQTGNTPGVKKTQELIWRNVQNLADLVDQREARLHLRPLIASVSVLLDSKRFGEIARALEPAMHPHGLDALCELRTHFWCEGLGHDARSFADPAQNVIAGQCILAPFIVIFVGLMGKNVCEA